MVDKTLQGDQKQRGWVNNISRPSEVQANTCRHYLMKSNKMAAEEPDTDKLGKPCSERDVRKWKWLATFSPPSDRHECAVHCTYIVRAQVG